MSSFAVVPITGADWARLRSLRLEMLVDTPTAYGESVEQARAISDDEWRERAGRNERPGDCGFAAVAADGTWVASARCYTPEESPRRPMVVGVYVAPAWRGADRGVLDALLARIESWARTDDHADALVLHVHERNDRALRAYAKRGFALNGNAVPYELDPSQRELEMEKALI